MFPLHTLNFEAPADAAPFAGGEPEVGVEETAPWAPDPEQWEQMVETTQMLREALQASQQEPEQPAAPQYQPIGPQQQEGPPDYYDDPEGFQRWIDARIEERTAPVTQFQQQLEQEQGRELGLDMLADMEAREGEFLMPDYSRERAYELADRYYAEAVQRYGNTPRAAEVAMQRGYKEARENEQAIGKAYHERELNQLATLSGAPRELPGTGNSGAQQVAIPEGGNEMDLVRRHFGHT
jgi:hypothetical protein